MRNVVVAGVMLGMAILGPVRAQTMRPDEFALLKVAQTVIKVDTDRQDLSWLSDHQLLICTTEHKPTLGDEAHNTWRGTLELLDTKTHEKTDWKEFTRLVQRTTVYPLQEPYDFQMSPDGVWILWGTGGDDLPSLNMAHKDGTAFRSWKHTSIEECFFADARHLVRISDDKPYVTIHDLQDPTKDKSFAKPALAGAAIATYAAPMSTFFVVPGPEERDMPGKAPIYTYRMADRAQRIAVYSNIDGTLPTPTEARAYSLLKGAKLYKGYVSPQQTAIVFHLYGNYGKQPQGTKGEQRPLSGKPLTKSILTEELWVSRPDGGSMRELGSVPGKLYPDGATQNILEKVQWLPDGKQVSFLYQGTLYLVSAEPD